MEFSVGINSANIFEAAWKFEKKGLTYLEIGDKINPFAPRGILRLPKAQSLPVMLTRCANITLREVAGCQSG